MASRIPLGKRIRIPLHQRRAKPATVKETTTDMPKPAPVRPYNVATAIWDSLTEAQQGWVMEHERMHEQLRQWYKDTTDLALYVGVDADEVRANFPFKVAD
jgi:hypothetical protein